jgi:hypothetical protein
VAAFAQYTPQTGPFTVTQVMPGQMVTGTLLPTTEALSAHVNLYSFYIWENATQVSINMVDTDTNACEYLHFYANSVTLPCSEYEYSNSFLCSLSYDYDDGYSYWSTTISPANERQDLAQWTPGSYMYFGIGRYDPEEYETDTCTYSIQINITSTCPSGQIAYYEDVDGTDMIYCSGSIIEINGTSYTSAMNMVSQGNYTQFYYMDVPQGTGRITVTATTSSDTLTITGRNYGMGEDYNCQTESYSTESNGVYTYMLNCYTPRAGDFYISLMDDNSFMNGSVSIMAMVCGTGMGGYNCTFTSVPFNSSMYPFSLYLYNYGGYLSYPFAYTYVDVTPNMNVTTMQMIIGASSINDGYVYLRKDGYPEDDSTYGFESSGEYHSVESGIEYFGLSPFEFYVGGRYYFGLECYESSGSGCNFTLGLNSTGSTSGMATTGMMMTTTMMMMNGTTGMHMNMTTTGMHMNMSTTGHVSTTGKVSTTMMMMTTSSEQESSSGFEMLIPTFVLAALALLF